MAASTPSSSISDLVNERLLFTSPRFSSLQWNAKPQDGSWKLWLEPNLDQEYASQEKMYKQNGEPAIESITAEWRHICLQQ